MQCGAMQHDQLVSDALPCSLCVVCCAPGHDHSPVPPQWPELADILQYRDSVRLRIASLYAQHSSSSSRATIADGTAAVVKNAQHSSSRANAANGTPAAVTSPRLGSRFLGTAAAPSGPHPDDTEEEEATAVCAVKSKAAVEAAAMAAGAAAVAAMPPELQHVLWMCFEHEAMHLETLLYMMVQFEGTLPPPKHLRQQCRGDAAAATASGFSNGSTARQHQHQQQLGGSPIGAPTAPATFSNACLPLPLPPPAVMVDLAGSTVVLGFDPVPGSTAVLGSHDPSNTPAAAHMQQGQPLRFGWDNEMPARVQSVGSCAIQHRPVCVLEYLWFVANQLAAAATGADATAASAASVAGGTHAAVQDACSVPDACAAGADQSTMTNSSSTTGCSGHFCSGGGDGDGSCRLHSRVFQLLGPDGALGHLLPLSLQLSSSAAAARESIAIPASYCGVGITACSCAASNGTSAQHSSSTSNGTSTSISDSAAGEKFGSSAVTAKPGSSRDKESSAGAAAQALFAVLQQLLVVKTVFGLVPISRAGLWPVYCSALQARAYANWWGGGSCRLPTEGELLLARQYNADLAEHYDAAADSGGNSSCSRNSDFTEQCNGNGMDVQAATDQVHNGLNGLITYEYSTGRAAATVKASPCSQACSTPCAPAATAAVDFSMWQPVNVQLQPAIVEISETGATVAPATVAAAAGSSSFHRLPLISQLTGNGWEWSSTVFESHPGFKPHMLYPEYSADFFDGKHYVLLGGSWATMGSIAGRASFRNWYQAGQQHVFAKFRLCMSCSLE